MANGNDGHWLLRGLEGVNVITLILLLLAGAKFYFDLDKDIALMKRDMADIQQKLSSNQDHLRRSDMPLYSYRHRRHVQSNQEKSYDQGL